MIRHGVPAAITNAGISPVTTLPAPITDPSPITAPLRTSDRAPMKTSSSMTMRLPGSGSGAYLRGIESSGWKSVSAIITSAPSRTRSPIVMRSAAQITAPLIPTSEPISIAAPTRRVRRITRVETPSAVRDAFEIRTLLGPIETLESRARLTIGRPIRRTAPPTSIPRERSHARQTIDDDRSLNPRKKLRSDRRRCGGFVPGLTASSVDVIWGDR